MAGRGATLWIKQAEEAKLKDEERKAAAARAAFDATFKDVGGVPAGTLTEQEEEAASDSDAEEPQKLANKPIGPVDAGKCTAAGTGVAGGAAGTAASFVVVSKDSDNRRVPHGGALLKVRISPGVGVGGVVQEAVVKDNGDGTYTVTYAVPKRGDYMVSVECNGLPILNSPFPVFFSGGNAPMANGLLPSTAGLLGSSSFGNAMGQTLSPFTGVASGLFPGMLGNHPPQAQLMAALAAGSSMGGMGQMPLPPSAAAIAAAQSIVAAQAYQAAQARAAIQESTASKESENEPGSPDDKQKEALLRTLQVSNLSPLLTADQLKTLFAYCGTVTDCQIASSKQLAYVEYSKPEEAKAGLALNNMEVGGRPINVEMAKSVPPKKSSSLSSSASAANGLQPLPVMMQQAVAMQQYQFQQALLMQQAMATQQAAVRAATVKSASEMAAARAAEISKNLKVDGEEQEEKDTSGARPPSRTRVRSRSKSRSPIRYRRNRRSRSFSRSPIRYRRDRRSRSRSRDRYRHRQSPSRSRGRFYRSREDYYNFHAKRRAEWESERVHEHRSSRRSRSPSRSKNRRSHSRPSRSIRDHSRSPAKVRNEEPTSDRQPLRSRSPVKGSRHSAPYNRKEADKNDKEKVTVLVTQKDEQETSDQLRHSKSPSGEPSPMKDSKGDCNEMKESPGAKVDRECVVLEHDVGPKQYPAEENNVLENTKASEDEDKGGDEHKSKRRHKKRHKKDGDHEKHDKKRKKHKHRHRRSPSASPDGLPLPEGGKIKAGSDDSPLCKKGHKKKGRPSRSTSSSSSASD